MHHNADRFAYPGPVLNGQDRARLPRVVVVGCILTTMMASVACSVERTGAPTDADLAIALSETPTATSEPTPPPTQRPTAPPEPTSTPTPVALAYDALFDRLDAPGLVRFWDMPIAHCDAVGEATSSEVSAEFVVPRGVSAIRCIDGDAAERSPAVVQAVADARIVQIGKIDPADDDELVQSSVLAGIEEDTDRAVAQWVDDGLLGNHIVLDIDLPAQSEVDPRPDDAVTDDGDEAGSLGPQVPPYRRSDPELDETPDPPPTQAPTAEPTESDPAATATAKPTPTSSAEPSETPEPSNTLDTEPSETPQPSNTPDTEPSETPEAEPSETPEPSDTPEPSEKTPEAEPSETPEAEPSETPEPSDTPEPVTSIQVVYGGMNSDFRHLELGERVRAGDILGGTNSDGAVLFGVWVDGVRQDNATAIATRAPSVTTQKRIADRLGKVILPPTSPECGLVKSQGRIPGAPREYRHGFHQGIDFVCTGADNEVTAVADGTVVYVVADYEDASVENRNALLGRAVPAGNTPYWTLTMLYGNVVVIDHGDIEDVGHVVTISAHLDSVEDDVTLGAKVKQDQVIGIVGTTGTNASADGLPNEDDPGQHLHWELFIDNWYLGQGLEPADVQDIIVDAVCEDGSPDCD